MKVSDGMRVGDRDLLWAKKSKKKPTMDICDQRRILRKEKRPYRHILRHTSDKRLVDIAMLTLSRLCRIAS